MRTCVCASDSDRRKGLVRMSDGIPNMLGHIAAAHAAGMSGPEALRAFNLRLDPSATEAEAEADLAEPMQLMARAEAHARRLEQMTDAERRAYAEAVVEDKEGLRQLPAEERATYAAFGAEYLNQMARAAAATLTAAPAAAAPGTRSAP